MVQRRKNKKRLRKLSDVEPSFVTMNVSKEAEAAPLSHVKRIYLPSLLKKANVSSGVASDIPSDYHMDASTVAPSSDDFADMPSVEMVMDPSGPSSSPANPSDAVMEDTSEKASADNESSKDKEAYVDMGDAGVATTSVVIDKGKSVVVERRVKSKAELEAEELS